MSEAAGVGVAMANASDAAKAGADYVTEHDNNHSGIAEVIEKFVL
jgi:hydroxymethylpyrimidine pyrophosphatase-like HAD family hydrolase